MSGEYDVALKLYKKLLERYDTRFEKDADSQESPQAMMEEDDEGRKEGEGRWSIFRMRGFVEGWRLAGVGRCHGAPNVDQILDIGSSNRIRGVESRSIFPGITDRRVLGLYPSLGITVGRGGGSIQKAPYPFVGDMRNLHISRRASCK